MSQRFKRIRNHLIEYIIILFIMLIMFSVAFTYIDKLDMDPKLGLFILVTVLLFVIIYLLYFLLHFLFLYHEIKKVNINDTYNEKIKVNKVSLINYGGYHRYEVSALKLYCNINDTSKVLYYILDNDESNYKKVKNAVKGYLKVSIYSNSKIINSLGIKLDKKINL